MERFIKMSIKRIAAFFIGIILAIVVIIIALAIPFLLFQDPSIAGYILEPDQ